jgi:hypothetical protein
MDPHGYFFDFLWDFMLQHSLEIPNQKMVQLRTDAKHG